MVDPALAGLAGILITVIAQALYNRARSKGENAGDFGAAAHAFADAAQKAAANAADAQAVARGARAEADTARSEVAELRERYGVLEARLHECETQRLALATELHELKSDLGRTGTLGRRKDD